ncbi:MAG: ribosome maturation factor RimM [Balneolaceae bacterium]|nr:ribosome maturation factor RimM [Balneolaceae bacterium]
MLEPVEDQYQIIGHVVNAHGVKGEVLVQPGFEDPGLFDSLSLLHYQNARGELVPARIERVRLQQKGDRLSFFVKFEHISDRNEATELRGSPLYVHRNKFAVAVEVEQPRDYRSWKACGEDGSPLGTVTAMLENPAHPILGITLEEDGRELLVPFVDEYIVSVDDEAEEIRCRRLDQLAGL